MRKNFKSCKDDYRFYYEVINNSDKTISTVDVYLILYDEEYDKPCFVRMECIYALRAHSSAIASFYIDEGISKAIIDVIESFNKGEYVEI